MARDSAAPASAKGRGAPPEARRSLVAPGSRGARPPRPALRPWPAWVDAVRVARGYVQGGVLSGDVIWGPAAGLGRRSSGPEPGLPQGGACGAGAIWGGTGAGRGSRRPGAAGAWAPAPRSGAAPVAAAAAGVSAGRPVRHSRGACHYRPGRPGVWAATCSYAAPAGAGARGRPLAGLRPAPPRAHLLPAQRHVAQAQQAQPARCGLRVALPGAELLQDDLLP